MSPPRVYDSVLIAENEPKLEQMQPGQIVLLQEDEQLTAYWLENEKMVNHSFPDSGVQNILQMLPAEGESSKDKDLIKAITSQYKCKEPKPNAANSLRTTAEEYAKFITTWVNDDTLNYAFNPVKPADSMINDYLPNPKSIGRLVQNITMKDSDRELVAWGLGIGLVRNTIGQIIGAYHTGDMGNETAQWRAGFGVVIDPVRKNCIEASVYLTKSPNGHILAEQVLPDILMPALNYFCATYGFARNVDELDGTNHLGLNPKIVIPGLSEAAYETKIPTQDVELSEQSIEKPTELPKSDESFTESLDSTTKMFHQMQIKPSAARPKSALKIDKPQEQEVSTDKPLQEVEETKDEEMQRERKFNPTPLSTSYDPYKK